MVAQNGADLIIKVGDNGEVETFATIGGLRLTRLVLNQRLVDSSHVGSGAWRELLAAGMRSLSISGNGVFTDSVTEERLRGYAFAGSLRHYQLLFGNGDLLSASFLLQSYERVGDHDTEERYAITLESAGSVTFAPAP